MRRGTNSKRVTPQACDTTGVLLSKPSSALFGSNGISLTALRTQPDSHALVALSSQLTQHRSSLTLLTHHYTTPHHIPSSH